MHHMRLHCTRLHTAVIASPPVARVLHEPPQGGLATHHVDEGEQIKETACLRIRMPRLVVVDQTHNLLGPDHDPLHVPYGYLPANQTRAPHRANTCCEHFRGEHWWSTDRKDNSSDHQLQPLHHG